MRMFYIFKLAIPVFVCFIGIQEAWGNDAFTAKKQVKWPTVPARAELNPNPHDRATVEFSLDGRFVCAWWLPPALGEMSKKGNICNVFDLQANRISHATGVKGQLVDAYVSMFPNVAWRHRFADFLTNPLPSRITLWGFTPDYLQGMRLLMPRYGAIGLGTVELWSFNTNPEKRWSVALPEEVPTMGMAVFFERDIKRYILLAFYGTRGYILSEADGSVVDSFIYGKKENEADVRLRKRKFGLMGDIEDVSFWFSSHKLTFDPARRLLACGDGYSTRFRVVSVDKPHQTVFEANSDHNPRLPWGGEWNVASLHFDAGGKYLVVGYAFGGRLTTKEYFPVEIYDTSSWKVVWSVNTPKIYSYAPPRISPNGEMMALMNGNWLEIGPFKP